MSSILIKNAELINENQRFKADVFINDNRIEEISKQGISRNADRIIDAEGLWLMPGVIDDQVHFREPGLTHKAEIYTEARAAVAGGVTSFMEMPNTVPQAITQELLQEKYDRAAQCALGNYSFFMGGTNDNVEEVLKTDPKNVCGIKLFMGSSTGNMLVDNVDTLRDIFSRAELLIATHCEDEETIRKNTENYKEKYGEDIPFEAHPLIRSVESCYKSSSMAVNLAKEYNTRLHILHISTAKELSLFRNDIPLKDKRITSEVCVHHLSFDSSQYSAMGSLIKCNPAIKTKEDQDALWEALLDDRLDIIATDHAPHTWEEKQSKYLKAPSGLPLIQHTLVKMLEHARNGKISVEKVVEKMCHAPADMFDIDQRGYIREGYWADLVLVDPSKTWSVNKNNLYYKCAWSPMEGETFHHAIHSTIVSGHLAFHNNQFDESRWGMRLNFNR
ncbi:dihydroorotase [bacterium]|nr:dihydroorotase [bacterium]